VTGIPTLTTARLVLRPFVPGDAARVQELAGDPLVADTTLNLPHPYLDGMAETWIGTHAPAWESREGGTWAITESAAGVVGTIHLALNVRHARGELGYWIGRQYWNRGFATEAAAELVRFGFESLGLNRIQARHMTRNPPSGRVMQKNGMLAEGVNREYFRKGDAAVSVAMYAILRADWLRRT
jgi:ribosomal-protein-alanine N-acetyltransferase